MAANTRKFEIEQYDVEIRVLVDESESGPRVGRG
jgi:hypothetical protein